MLGRPSEAVTASVGSIVGSALVVIAAFTHVQVPAEVAGAIVILVSWIATAVTAYTARRQSAGTLSSGPAGEVQA